MTDLSDLDLDLTTIAHLEARDAVQRDARREGVPVTPPVWPGPEYYTATSGLAEPLAGLGFASTRAWAAQSVVQEYIYHARQAGHTWDAIGRALGMGDAAGDEAFRCAVAPISRPFVHSDTFSWTCPDCRQRIADRGPTGGLPGEGEPGHAPGCARLAAMIRAHEQAGQL